MSAYCGLPVRCELSLGSRRLDLMDQAQGFRIAALDIAFPSVRADVSDAPQQSGVVDLTKYFGARAVTISGSIIEAAVGSRTASLQLLAPFMDPAARPILTYQTDVDTEPRQLSLRAADLSAPLNALYVTSWSASFTAPSGLAQSIDEDEASCGPSFLVQAGRRYDLTFDRTYPTSAASDQISVVPDGDYPSPPVFTLYGPATGAEITVVDESTSSAAVIDLQESFTVAAGRFITIDCHRRTIEDDTGQNVYGDALGAITNWPVLIPGDVNVISFFCEGAAGSTLLRIQWWPRWLI